MEGNEGGFGGGLVEGWWGGWWGNGEEMVEVWQGNGGEWWGIGGGMEWDCWGNGGEMEGEWWGNGGEWQGGTCMGVLGCFFHSVYGNPAMIMGRGGGAVDNWALDQRLGGRDWPIIYVHKSRTYTHITDIKHKDIYLYVYVRFCVCVDLY